MDWEPHAGHAHAFRGGYRAGTDLSGRWTGHSPNRGASKLDLPRHRGHTTNALQPDLALYLCIGAGSFIELLAALSIAGVIHEGYPIRQGHPGKALLAFVSTLLAAFFCWVLIAQFLHHTPFLWPPHLTFQPGINPTWARIWLLYYLIIRVISVLPAPNAPITFPGQCLYRYEMSTPLDEKATHTLIIIDQPSTSTPPSVQTSTPISRAHAGGPKWQHIENCYDLYRKALQRFNPPPFELKTPDGFRYYDGGGQQIFWYKHTLLLPELARQLMHYNAPDLFVFEFLKSYPTSGCATLLYLVTFNFLALPTAVKNVAGQRWQGERVLDADLYACQAGEARRLRDRLKSEQATLKQEGLVDAAFPTLDERLEQITAFINEEAR